MLNVFVDSKTGLATNDAIFSSNTGIAESVTRTLGLDTTLEFSTNSVTAAATVSTGAASGTLLIDWAKYVISILEELLLFTSPVRVFLFVTSTQRLSGLTSLRRSELKDTEIH